MLRVSDHCCVFCSVFSFSSEPQQHIPERKHTDRGLLVTELWVHNRFVCFFVYFGQDKFVQVTAVQSQFLHGTFRAMLERSVILSFLFFSLSELHFKFRLLMIISRYKKQNTQRGEKHVHVALISGRFLKGHFWLVWVYSCATVLQ